MTDIGMKTALLVIDVQASFTVRSYWDPAELPAYLAAQNGLIAGFAERGLPIVRIFHVDPEGAFSEASGLVRPLDGLQEFSPALTLKKHAHSAFAGSSLAAWLTAQGIGRVAISGIRSEQCCETTARDASDRGFAVDYVTPATLTFAMQSPSGRTYSSAEIKDRCELVLANRFAAIHSVESLLAEIDAAAPARRAA